MGASILLVGVGALIVYQTRGLITGDDPLGPGFLPIVIGVALIGLSLLLGWQALRTRPQKAIPGETYDRVGVARVAGASAAMVGLVVGLAWVPEIGFPVMSTAIVFVLTILFGGRPGLRTLLFAALLSIAVYVVFRIWFKLPLPGPVWS